MRVAKHQEQNTDESLRMVVEAILIIERPPRPTTQILGYKELLRKGLLIDLQSKSIRYYGCGRFCRLLSGVDHSSSISCMYYALGTIVYSGLDLLYNPSVHLK
jgi:hypothetical protein